MHRAANKILNSGVHIVKDHSVMPYGESGVEEQLIKAGTTFACNQMYATALGCVSAEISDEHFPIIGGKLRNTIMRLNSLGILDHSDCERASKISTYVFMHAVEFANLSAEEFGEQAA
jgi:hypothetical protein